jgi:hypothetical protein
MTTGGVCLECVLYHGTDKKYANDIISNGFVVKENRRHWLGNGIYFFTDEALARWWTTNPSKKFGHNISSPAIIQCVFASDDDTILDLRKFDDYTYCFEQFQHFYNNMYRPYCTMREIDINRLRCTFFDWLFDTHQYTAIIGTFLSAEQPYYKPIRQAENNFKNLNLAYNEVQVCIPEARQGHIVDMKIQMLGS